MEKIVRLFRGSCGSSSTSCGCKWCLFRLFPAREDLL